MARSEPDDLAEELFTDLAEDFDADDREFVWAVGVVEVADYRSALGVGAEHGATF